MPVFNRLEMTQAMLDDLRAQNASEALTIVVVDDGSSDGTAAFLADQKDVAVVQGDGALWWGGSIHVGLAWIFARAANNDWVLMVNNDTHIPPDFVQALLKTARECSPCAVGSIIRDKFQNDRILSIGPTIDAWRMLVKDRLADGGTTEDMVFGVDALSGRGVLFPMQALRAVRGMRPRWLPHYLADYELALRVRAAGWKLLVTTAAAVYSSEEYGNTFRGRNLRERFFSVRSPSYLPAQLRFWWGASSAVQKWTLPLRLALFSVFPRLREKL
jgi:GT2 family glycosyltransferase